MKKLFCIIMCLCVFCTGCQSGLGSFTFKKTYSYDEKFYATNETVFLDGEETIFVKIYTNEDELMQLLYFTKSKDFFGICWEQDNYNLWVQTEENGVFCYSYGGVGWDLNSTIIKPDYIITKK